MEYLHFLLRKVTQLVNLVAEEISLYFRNISLSVSKVNFMAFVNSQKLR